MPAIRKQNYIGSFALISDTLAVIASVFLTYFVRFHTGLIMFKGEAPPLLPYAQALIVILPVYLGFFQAYGLYQGHRHIRRIEEIFLVIKAVTFAMIVLMACTFVYRGFSYSRNYVMTLWVISILLLSIARYFLIQWEYYRKVQQKELSNVLIVGANRNARNIIQWAKNNPHYGQHVVGVLAREATLVGKHLEGVPILGITDQCESFIDSLKPNQVVLLDSTFPRDRIANLVAICEDQWIEFKIGADFYGLMSRNVDVEYISSVPLLGFRELPLDSAWNRFLKRSFDIIVTSLLLILTIPFCVLATILVKMNGKGPLFYEQERMGRDQKLFKVTKFRTMKVDAEKETGPVWAKANDDRRTWAGNFLRRWNLDELPQLLNVLRGDMSLVGPRPERPHFIEQFRQDIPRYMARHKIKSGLTGWAQVNGFRGNTSIQERIKYDLYYMENWSLLMDIEILFMTLFAFKNAY